MAEVMAYQLSPVSDVIALYITDEWNWRYFYLQLKEQL